MASFATWPVTVTPPWPHQAEALDHVLRDLSRGGGSGLFLRMGEGKSNVVLATIGVVRPKRTLIVCPKSMLQEWPQKFMDHYHAPVEVRVLTGSTKARADKLWDDRLAYFDRPYVAIINYEALVYPVVSAALLNTGFDLVVLDESHKIKKPGGKASLVCSQLSKRTPYRMCLTGTPTHHSPLDVYAQYRFLDPSIFGTNFSSFRQRYEITKTGHNGKYQEHVDWRNLDDLSDRMYKIAFRVEGDVLSLPDKIEQVHPISLDSKTAAAYKKLQKELVLDLRKGVVVAKNALSRLLRLQQITSGYLPVVDLDGDGETAEVQIGTEKYDALCDILDGLGPKEPVVVFARFHHDLDRIKAAAEASGRKAYELSGRRDQRAAWYNDNRPTRTGGVLAVQETAGSAGIDLTPARHMIFYSTGFSLGNHLQAIARVYRPGQTWTTYVHHLICKGTVDEYVREAILANADIASYVTDRLSETP